ncbi:MAG: SRPBCC family protein [Ilumatobacteraceae bacterium]
MTPDVQVTRAIAAPPNSVFAALTDITRMGEWSPETVRAEWNDGVTEAAVGAAFTGFNRHGDKEWTTEATITEYVPDERFFFDCSVRDFVFAKWGYSIEAADGGSIVTEHAQDLRPESALERSAQISGVTDRLTHNRLGMEATLERLAAALEGTSPT